MNPYDANTHPGTHLVAETLGISEISTPNITHRPGEPLYQSATRMIGAAHELDELHNRVTDAAKDALRLLEPVGRGELRGARVSYALLRTAVPKIGDLLSQQDRAYDQLVGAISAYQRLLPGAGAAEHSEASAPDRPAPTSGMASTPTAGPPAPSPEQLRALEEIKRSRVWLKERVMRSGLRVATEAGAQRLDIATVLTMHEAGWVERDTSTTLRLGQRLALTTLGESVFRTGCSADLRVAAALHRGAQSTAPTRPSTNPAAPPPAAKPGLSR
ncbi:hypothetical protein GCM10012285_41360 [Streptomyces kronopolitis]|uniref:Large ATP-binding protein n=1 Tax=Streptomyces kronopolitis TaxID=1612435 RepID=A0ABQ2JPT2_9ACTN|nr:large ATP-binding protein [Streptomyces kronopolitis]GGN51339.1 hypothetical protein GCM10012285_41360 [Streptomyces kronopolitis]